MKSRGIQFVLYTRVEQVCIWNIGRHAITQISNRESNEKEKELRRLNLAIKSLLTFYHTKKICFQKTRTMFNEIEFEAISFKSATV